MSASVTICVKCIHHVETTNPLIHYCGMVSLPETIEPVTGEKRYLYKQAMVDYPHPPCADRNKGNCNNFSHK